MTQKMSHPAVLAAALTLSVCAAGGCADVLRRPAAPAERAAPSAPEATWSLIGSYSTAFDPVEIARNHNIAMATAHLDGALIPPGGRWSFNRQVGERTRARGFEIAPVLEFEGAVPALGGGICQVSTTVYNAALLADLQVAERHPHSRPVAYVALGRDATVSWGAKDLKIVNPHDVPVRLRAFVRHGRLVVQAWAPRPLGYEVRLSTADTEPASPRKEYQNLDHPDRLAVGGLWIKLYRHRVRHGSIYETERVGRSSFYPFRIEEAP